MNIQVENTTPEPDTQAGFVAIVGRPNVGKSTLMNQLLGQKLSITSHKPHTTRHRIHGIYTEDRVQMVFVDTPGMHLANHRRRLNQMMNQAAKSALSDVDLILWLVSANQFGEEDKVMAQMLKHAIAPVILLVNKVDKIAKKTDLLPYLTRVNDYVNAIDLKLASSFPMSAYTQDHIAALKKVIQPYLPLQPFIFPEDMVTDRPMRFLAAEIVREKLMRQMGDELPYGMSVEIEEFDWREEEHRYIISAVIYVESKNHKPMVIGTKGQQLKQIGQDAREDMMHLTGERVHLNLWVKVKENWADDDKALASLGYQGEN